MVIKLPLDPMPQSGFSVGGNTQGTQGGCPPGVAASPPAGRSRAPNDGTTSSTERLCSVAFGGEKRTNARPVRSTAVAYCNNKKAAQRRCAIGRVWICGQRHTRELETDPPLSHASPVLDGNLLVLVWRAPPNAWRCPTARPRPALPQTCASIWRRSVADAVYLWAGGCYCSCFSCLVHTRGGTCATSTTKTERARFRPKKRSRLRMPDRKR